MRAFNAANLPARFNSLLAQRWFACFVLLQQVEQGTMKFFE